jgi:hypothetical protein
MVKTKAKPKTKDRLVLQPPPGARFRWREGSRFTGDATETGRAILELSHKYGSGTSKRMAARFIVDEALNGSSPEGELLARHFGGRGGFEDVKGAAYRHWESIARKLLCDCEIVRVTGGITYAEKLWVNVKVEHPDETVESIYMPRSQAMARPDLMDHIVEDCRARLRTMRLLYGDLLGLYKLQEIASEELEERAGSPT